jgi:hypothetical protein
MNIFDDMDLRNVTNADPDRNMAYSVSVDLPSARTVSHFNFLGRLTPSVSMMRTAPFDTETNKDVPAMVGLRCPVTVSRPTLPERRDLLDSLRARKCAPVLKRVTVMSETTFTESQHVNPMMPAI